MWPREASPSRRIRRVKGTCVARKQEEDDELLLRRFFAAFSKLDDLLLDDPDVPACRQLERYRDDTPSAQCRWRPTPIVTERSELAELYKHLPCRLPSLFEDAICSYRWLGVHLGDRLRLFANPTGEVFAGLLQEINADPLLAKVLLPLGLIPFGRDGSGSYDPVCFATRKWAGSDCPVVRVAHESVLRDERIGDTWEVAPSFRQLAQWVIDEAEGKE
jgi:hypothetical protein